MTRIQLIGPPQIGGPDGVVRELRGQKPWALLARILLADRPMSRRELANELFSEAADPLASLRWTLAELRRALGDPSVLGGDPVQPGLPATFTVDVLDLDGVDLDVVGTGEFLQGIDAEYGPEFGTWLLVVRQQVASHLDEALHRRALTALSRGRTDEAVRVADLAARRAPYDEGAQIVLVRSLIAAGRPTSAVDHVERVEALFQRELGRDPSPALRSAARVNPADAPPGISQEVQATTLLEAGRAALAAGATDAGLDCLRRAVACADSSRDAALRTTTMFALGEALVHQGRGFDVEGAVLLGQVIELAHTIGDTAMAGAALAEVGYAETLAGRRQAAEEAFVAAQSFADDDLSVLVPAIAHQGFNLTDWGRFPEALDLLETARELSNRLGDRKWQSRVLGLVAWALLRSGDIDQARDVAEQSRALSSDIKWAAFEPFPLMMLAECDLTDDRAPTRRGDLERLFAMTCQLRDPCWEGGAARVMAMHHAANGDHGEALRWIRDAYQRSTRLSDTWVAMIGEILLTEATIRRAADDRAGFDAAAREAVAYAARSQLDDALARGLTLLRSA